MYSSTSVVERKRVVLFVLNKEFERIECALRFSFDTFETRMAAHRKAYEGGKARKKKIEKSKEFKMTARYAFSIVVRYCACFYNL